MKRFFPVTFGLLGLIALGLFFVLLRQPKPTMPGPLVLPDGSSVSLVAVTYGTNHVVGPPLARLVAKMPPQLRAILTRLLGPRATVHETTTSNPQLVVWLDRNTNNAVAPPGPGSFSVFLADASGFISGNDPSLYSGWANLVPLAFQVVPRRDPQISVQFFYFLPTGGKPNCGSLTCANPVFGNFPQWTPEPLPATKRIGDVAVTLEKLSTGHDNNSAHHTLKGGGTGISFGTNRTDGQNTTVVMMRMRSLTDTNQVWRVAGEEISDATGNTVRNGSMSYGSYNDGYFTFSPGLWTNEAAWKIRCEIKRAEGFTSAEQFTFHDVPLGELDLTNRVGWTTNFCGVTVTMEHIRRRAPHTNQNSWSGSDLSQAHFTTAGLTNGVHLDLISTRVDTGTNLATGGWSSAGDERTYDYMIIPREAKTADFTFAVQHSRWVEFTVQPEVGTARIERPAPPKQ